MGVYGFAVQRLRGDATFAHYFGTERVGGVVAEEKVARKKVVTDGHAPRSPAKLPGDAGAATASQQGAKEDAAAVAVSTPIQPARRARRRKAVAELPRKHGQEDTEVGGECAVQGRAHFRHARPSNAAAHSSSCRKKKSAKTKLCTYWEAGNCRLGRRCSFAHGEGELQPVHSERRDRRGAGK